MAKKKDKGYYEIFPDIQQVFDDVIIRIGLDKHLTIKVLALDSLRTIFKLKKPDTLMKFETGIDLYIIINQRIFEGLPVPLQTLQVEETLAGVNFDGKITQPNVKTYSGLLNMYGYDEAKKGAGMTYQVLTESIKSLFDKAKDEDAQKEG